MSWLALLIGMLLSAGLAWAEPVMTAHHANVQVGTASLQVRASSTARRYLAIINDSSVVVYCAIDDTAARSNFGIRLAAAGTAGDRIVFDRNVPSGAVNCLAASGADNQILVIEGR